jgi:hypothetical protein
MNPKISNHSGNIKPKKTNYKLILFVVFFVFSLVYLYFNFQEGQFLKLDRNETNTNNDFYQRLFVDGKYKDSNKEEYTVDITRVVTVRYKSYDVSILMPLTKNSQKMYFLGEVIIPLNVYRSKDVITPPGNNDDKTTIEK